MSANTPALLVALRRKRLAQWIAGKDGKGKPADFVRKTGINQGELSGLLRDKSFGEKKAAVLEAAAGMPSGFLTEGSDEIVDALIAGYQPTASRADPPDFTFIPSTGTFNENDLVFVRRLAALGSCGGGKNNGHDEDLQPLAFRRDWLQRKGVDPNQALVMSADGDSMADYISDGDVVLFNTARTSVRSGVIYAVEHPDGTKIKRLFIGLDRSVTLRSDNPDKKRYPDEHLDVDQADHLKIIGEFVWRGGG